MKINGDMVVLAREIRGITQEKLARLMYTSQATVTRIESDKEADIDDARLELLSSSLDFPVEFFLMKEELLGFGSSAYFYRKRASLTALDRKRIHGIVNILRISAKKILQSVEIEPKRPLPFLEIEEYGDATKIAQTVRAFWNIPDGPVANLTGLIESAGVIVISCDFGCTAMDATSLRLSEMPPLIFINKDIPGDRWRFTLAHELGHLIMHQMPHELIEEEADEFAAEFLMPAFEMKAIFSRLQKIRLVDLINLKQFWRVSVAALIERANSLSFLEPNTRRNLWVSLKRIGYPNEPSPISKEEPKNFRNMLNYFLNELKYTPEELARKLFFVNSRDLAAWHGPSCEALLLRPVHLKAVRNLSSI
jgi:Zn-dependent peptidase ImmA (M78 family)